MIENEHIRMTNNYTLKKSGIDGLPVVLKVGDVVDTHPRLSVSNMNSLLDLGEATQAPATNKVNITFDPDIKYCIYEEVIKDGDVYKANKDTGGEGVGWVEADWDMIVKGQTLPS